MMLIEKPSKEGARAPMEGCPATDISTNSGVPARLKHIDAHPLLSCYDIQILFATNLPGSEC